MELWNKKRFDLALSYFDRHGFKVEMQGGRTYNPSFVTKNVSLFTERYEYQIGYCGAEFTPEYAFISCAYRKRSNDFYTPLFNGPATHDSWECILTDILVNEIVYRDESKVVY